MVLALVFAFVMVGFSIALSIPIMLFGLSLAESGWTWQHAALFSAMVASTDAVAGEGVGCRVTPYVGAEGTSSFKG